MKNSNNPLSSANFYTKGTSKNYLTPSASNSKSPFTNKRNPNTNLNYNQNFQKLQYGIAQTINPTSNIAKKTNTGALGDIAKGFNALLGVISLPFAEIEGFVGKSIESIRTGQNHMQEIGSVITSQFGNNPYQGINMLEDITGAKEWFNHLNGASKFFLNAGVDFVAGFGIVGLEKVAEGSVGAISRLLIGDSIKAGGEDVVKNMKTIAKNLVGNPLKATRQAVGWGMNTLFKASEKSLENGSASWIAKVVNYIGKKTNNFKMMAGKNMILGFQTTATGTKSFNELFTKSNITKEQLTNYMDKMGFDAKRNIENFDNNSTLQKIIKTVYGKEARNKQQLFQTINETNVGKDFQTRFRKYNEGDASVKFNKNEKTEIMKGVQTKIFTYHKSKFCYDLLTHLKSFSSSAKNKEGEHIVTHMNFDIKDLKDGKGGLITKLDSNKLWNKIKIKNPLLYHSLIATQEDNPFAILKELKGNKGVLNLKFNSKQIGKMNDYIEQMEKETNPSNSDLEVMGQNSHLQKDSTKREILKKHESKGFTRNGKGSFLTKQNLKKAKANNIDKQVENIPQMKKDIIKHNDWQKSEESKSIERKISNENIKKETTLLNENKELLNDLETNRKVHLEKKEGKQSSMFQRKHKLKSLTESKIEKQASKYKKEIELNNKKIETEKENLEKNKSSKEPLNPYKKYKIPAKAIKQVPSFLKFLDDFETKIEKSVGGKYVRDSLNLNFKDNNMNWVESGHKRIEKNISKLGLVSAHHIGDFMKILTNQLKEKTGSKLAGEGWIKALTTTGKLDNQTAQTIRETNLKNESKSISDSLVKSESGLGQKRSYSVTSIGKNITLHNVGASKYFFAESPEEMLKSFGYFDKKFSEEQHFVNLWGSGDISTLLDARGGEEARESINRRITKQKKFNNEKGDNFTKTYSGTTNINGHQIIVIDKRKDRVWKDYTERLGKNNNSTSGKAFNNMMNTLDKNARGENNLINNYLAISPGIYDTMAHTNKIERDMRSYGKTALNAINKILRLWKSIKLFSVHFPLQVGLGNAVNAHMYGFTKYAKYSLQAYRHMHSYNKIIKRWTNDGGKGISNVVNKFDQEGSWFNSISKHAKNEKELKSLEYIKELKEQGIYSQGMRGDMNNKDGMIDFIKQKMRDSGWDKTAGNLEKSQYALNFFKRLVYNQDNAARMAIYSDIMENGIKKNLTHFVDSDLKDLGKSAYRGSKKEWNEFSDSDKKHLAKKLSEIIQIQYGSGHMTNFENNIIKKLVPFYAYSKGNILRVFSQIFSSSKFARQVFDINHALYNFSPKDQSKIPGYNFMAGFLPVFNGNTSSLVKITPPAFEATNVFNGQIASRLNPFIKLGTSLVTGRNIETGEVVPWYNSLGNGVLNWTPYSQWKTAKDTYGYIASGGKKGQLFNSIKAYDMKKVMAENYYQYTQYLIKTMTSSQRYLYFRYLSNFKEMLSRTPYKSWVKHLGNTNPFL